MLECFVVAGQIALWLPDNREFYILPEGAAVTVAPGSLGTGDSFTDIDVLIDQPGFALSYEPFDRDGRKYYSRRIILQMPIEEVASIIGECSG